MKTVDTHWDAGGAEVPSRDEILRINADLDQQVQRGAAQLQVVNEEFDSFCASVSHDLRSPLAIVAGFGRLLAKEIGTGAGTERSQEHLSTIQSVVVQMRELIDALLLLAQTSRAALNVETFDLSAVASKALEGCRAGEPARVVETDVEPGLIVRGDPHQLRQVMANLVGNAWKFTARQPEARIAFGRSGPDAEPVYFVRDNGAGFDMDSAAQLFGPFQRLHDHSDYEGVGIGLAMASRIIKRHGGRIWADAKPDEGATFFFTLAVP